MATQKIYDVYHTDFRGIGGSPSGGGITLDDVTLNSSLSLDAPMEAQSNINKQAAATALGISTNELDKLWNGDYLRFKFEFFGADTVLLITLVSDNELVIGCGGSVDIYYAFRVSLMDGVYSIVPLYGSEIEPQ